MSLIEEEQITTSIPYSVKETLEQAAQLTGTTLDRFLIESALKEADRILDRETTIILSERDAELVFSLIKNPPPPNEKLKAAAAKHRQFFHETH